MESEIAATITACTGDRVIVTEERMQHVLKKEHFNRETMLGYLEIILRDPSDIFWEPKNISRSYLLFYRREIQGYFVAIIKRTPQEAFLCTLHPTGRKVRNKHLILERIK